MTITLIEGRRWPLLGAGLILALAARWSCRDFLTDDVRDWVIPWYNYILDHGVAAFGVDIPSTRNASGNYPPTYYYLLYIATLFDAEARKLYLIKAVSILFDFVAAFFVYKIVRVANHSTTTPWLAFLAVLFAPTVIANGALWGQCDVIYASLILGSIYFSLVSRPFWSVVFFGLALSVKAQAVFLFPYLLSLVLCSALPWSYLLLIPVVYALAMAPAILMGRSVTDVFQIYLRQASVFHELSMRAPNLYYFIPSRFYWIAVIIGTITWLASLFFAWHARSRQKALSPQFLVFSATVSLMLAPFLLPKMHDRYFFAADLCSIALAFIAPRFWFVPVGLQISSMLAYVPILCEFGDPYQRQLIFCEFKYVDLPVAVFVNTFLACYLVSVYFARRSLGAQHSSPT